MNHYIKERILGQGTFGTVWLVKSTRNSNDYVLKDIKLIEMTETERERALTEVTILSKCRHNNIVGYKDHMFNYQTGSLYILMEYADGGDLLTAIKKQKGVPFEESNVISWFIQICLALQYIHYNNVLHRDLKSKNIFLTKNKVIKVGDFGIARVLKNSEDSATTKIGTPYYLSPEICRQEPYNCKCDMWALGVILFEISALEHPFVATDLFQLIHLILKCKRRNLPNWSGPVIRELVDDLLNLDPIQRPSADEILANPSLQPYLAKFSSKTKIPKFIEIRNAETLQKKDSFKGASEKNFGLKVGKTQFTSTGKLHVHSNSSQLDFQTGNGNHQIFTKDNKRQTNLDATYLVSSQNQVDDQHISPKQIGTLKNKVEINGSETNFSICSSSISLSKSSCQHSQCHQCMIDMFWKNRIHACHKTSINNEEYCELQKKLFSIFKKENFQHIYHSLLKDWNEIGNLQISSKSYTKSLTYEQMQHLPLMMQLVQLDMLKNFRK